MATLTAGTEYDPAPPDATKGERALWAEIADHVADMVRRGLVLESGWPGRPLHVTPLPTDGVVYSRERAEHVVKVLGDLEHIKGPWAGRPLKLLDFQVLWEIAPVFGLLRFDDEHDRWVRTIRTAWFEKPRKNGKSTECSGLGLVLAFADGEPGAEVYAAARNRDQAKLVFTPAVTMAQRCGTLYRKLGARGITKNLLENTATSSLFRPLASDLGGSLHGLNVHGGVIDEVHIHKTSDTVDAIETGTGSRLQPLILFITTADEGVVGSIYDTKRSYLERLCARSIKDPTWYGVVFAASPEQIERAPFADETLIAANPGVGHTVQMAYLRKVAREAQGSPSELNRYLRLHLGKRTKQSTKWLTLDRWDAAMGLAADPASWVKAPAYGGLDLSATTDFTAAVLLAPDPDGPGYIGTAQFWIPEERVEDLERRLMVPLRQWHREGFIAFTEGNVVDYERCRADFAQLVRDLGCTLVEVGYDPWNAAETVQAMERDGLTMVPLRQGYGTLSNPTKEVERLVMGSTPEVPLLRFGWNPVLRWMADCAEVMQDPNGNIKPTKPDRRQSAARIDGIAALVNAMARAMLRQPPKRRRRGGFG